MVASELGDLHSSRNRADYQLDKLDVEKANNAQAIVTLSGELIRSLDASFGGPNRSRIQDALRQWRKANGYP